MRAVEPAGGFRNAAFHDGEGGFPCIFQGEGQCLLFIGGEGGQNPSRQVKLWGGLGAYSDFYPGEGLTAQLLNNGFNAVVPAGGTFRPNAKSPRSQGNIVKQDDDPLGRNPETSACLLRSPVIAPAGPGRGNRSYDGFWRIPDQDFPALQSASFRNLIFPARLRTDRRWKWRRGCAQWHGRTQEPRPGTCTCRWGCCLSRGWCSGRAFP